MPENDPIELSVIILCYLADDEIISFSRQIISEVEQLGITYEIVLVANFKKNTRDTTPEIALKLASENPKIRAITREKEGGMGWDMKSGLDAARGHYLAIIDGDGQMPASDVPLVFDIIKTGRYDLVKTYRAQRFDGIYRKVLSDLYNLVFRILYHPTFPIRDINSKPKIFTRAAYQQMKLHSNDWFTDAEIMIQALALKFRICEVSTIFYKNERRASFVGLQTILEFLYNLLFYRFRR